MVGKLATELRSSRVPFPVANGSDKAEQLFCCTSGHCGAKLRSKSQHTADCTPLKTTEFRKVSLGHE